MISPEYLSNSKPVFQRNLENASSEICSTSYNEVFSTNKSKLSVDENNKQLISRYRPVTSVDGYTYSLDKFRIDIKCSARRYLERCKNVIEDLNKQDGIRVGKIPSKGYRTVYAIHIDGLDSAIVAAFEGVNANADLNGYIVFNPNIHFNCEKVFDILCQIRQFCYKFESTYQELAIDIPEPKNIVHLNKNTKQKSEYRECYDTEYLGKWNKDQKKVNTNGIKDKDNSKKLYDKKQERVDKLKLTEEEAENIPDLTRLETGTIIKGLSRREIIEKTKKQVDDSAYVKREGFSEYGKKELQKASNEKYIPTLLVLEKNDDPLNALYKNQHMQDKEKRKNTNGDNYSKHLIDKFGRILNIKFITLDTETYSTLLTNVYDVIDEIKATPLIEIEDDIEDKEPEIVDNNMDSVSNEADLLEKMKRSGIFGDEQLRAFMGYLNGSRDDLNGCVEDMSSENEVNSQDYKDNYIRDYRTDEEYYTSCLCQMDEDDDDIINNFKTDKRRAEYENRSIMFRSQ